MNKHNLILLLLVLLNSIFCSIKSSNLRKTEEVPEIDYLLTGLPTSYDLLHKEFLSEITSVSKVLSLSYFKSLESSPKIKYYLNKDKGDFDSIINDVISLMGISNPKHSYVVDTIKNKIPQYEEYFNSNRWMNYNIVTTVRNDANTIAFGSLFASFVGGKYNFIFCYGSGNFPVNFSGSNAVFLGKEGDWRYIATSISSTYDSKDLVYDDTYYIIRFMNLAAFKIIGNKYNIPLPYPNID